MKKSEVKQIIKEEIKKILNESFTNVHEFIDMISKEKPELKWMQIGSNKYYGKIQGGQFNALIWFDENGNATEITVDIPTGTTTYDNLDVFYRAIVKNEPVTQVRRRAHNKL